MKKAITVTPQNMAMVLGFIKNALAGKSYFTSRNVYTTKLAKAHELLIANPGWSFVQALDKDGKETRQTLLSQKYRHSIASVKIESFRDCGTQEDGKFIAIRNHAGHGQIINVNDEVRINHQGIFILSKDSCIPGQYIHALQFS